MKISRPALPGPGRLAAVAVAVAVAGLGLPQWSSPERWWWLAGAAMVVVVLLAWRRGLYLTTIVRRWFGLLARNLGWRRAGSDPLVVRDSVLLRVDGPDPHLSLLPVLAGYLDRYGVRCATVRITRREPDGSTWVGLTVCAAENLAALRARSATLPLTETANIVRRRLADHLRELGWAADQVDSDGQPIAPGTRRERWRAVQTDAEFVAAYRVPIGDSLADDIDRLRPAPGRESWTVLELSGTPHDPELSAAFALITEDCPGREPPVAGLVAQVGIHRAALAAMSPTSTAALIGPTHPARELLATLATDAGLRHR